MIGLKTGFTETDELTGQSRFAVNLENIISSVSKSRSCILISGERGTGKSLAARKIHTSVNPDSTAFVEINCNCLESDNTPDADNTPDGKVSFIKDFLSEIAKKSEREERTTVYFRHVDRLNLTFQNCLLDFIKSISSVRNVRFVFSTTANIDRLVNENKFQKELFMMISTVLVNMLPLSEREDDAVLIAEYFYEKFNKLSGNVFAQLPLNENLLARIRSFYWKGNIAELRNCMEHAFLVAEPPYISLSDLNLFSDKDSNIGASSAFLENLTFSEENSVSEDYSLKSVMDKLKKEYVTKVLQQTSWNQTKASKILGIQRTYVIKLMNELDIHKQM